MSNGMFPDGVTLRDYDDVERHLANISTICDNEAIYPSESEKRAGVAAMIFTISNLVMLINPFFGTVLDGFGMVNWTGEGPPVWPEVQGPVNAAKKAKIVEQWRTLEELCETTKKICEKNCATIREQLAAAARAEDEGRNGTHYGWGAGPNRPNAPGAPPTENRDRSVPPGFEGRGRERTREESPNR